jgi:putative hydrolase of the HAD superfamily
MGKATSVKLILWDFDGTLGYRDGGWTGTLLEVLHRHRPGFPATRDDVRRHLQSGFPWQTPDVPHTHLRSAEQWWAALAPVFEKAYLSVGIGADEAARLAAEVRTTYLDAARWRLYEDTVPVLRSLASSGWTHRVLSNHVPELEPLLGTLGIRDLFQSVYTSGQTGYEKPHHGAFEVAIGPGADRSAVWMVGDSLTADVGGAHRVGVSAILVRNRSDLAPYCCDDLAGVPIILENTPVTTPALMNKEEQHGG